jgi:hypothetical protein
MESRRKNITFLACDFFFFIVRLIYTQGVFEGKRAGVVTGPVTSNFDDLRDVTGVASARSGR